MFIHIQEDNVVIEIVNELKDVAKIVVIGVGGGGCNAVDRMIASNTDVEYWCSS